MQFDMAEISPVGKRKGNIRFLFFVFVFVFSNFTCLTYHA